MNVGDVLLLNIGITLGLMTLLWLLSTRLRDVSIVDLYWGPGFGVIAVATFIQGDGYPPRMWLLTTLTVIWALRLGLHLMDRNLGHGEDARYAKMRREVEDAGGNYVLRSWLTVFIFQGVIMWTVALPVQLGQLYSEPASLGWLAALGVFLWLVGFLFEAVGDWQLRRFRADAGNKGRVLDTGLWRYTRHPNYFGNACLWWGLYLIAAEVGPAAWCFFSPLLMSFFLIKVSGVSLLEKSLKSGRPGYEDYVRRTSSFIPWPPKR